MTAALALAAGVVSPVVASGPADAATTYCYGFEVTVLGTAGSERIDASDGVESVGLYRRSAACYTAVGQADAAARMTAEGDWMARRIEEDFTTHRLRLTRAMEQQRWPDALLETRALIALTRHREHAYVQWLTRNERRLQLLVDSGRRS